MKIGTEPLENEFVRLEPYSPGLRDEVREALDVDPDAWQLFSIAGYGEHFDSWWSGMLDGMEAGTWVSFAIRDLASGRIAGSSSYLEIRPEKQTVEIGATFIHPEFRGGHVNPSIKLLMLGHAFECGARRVELMTDARNARSRAALTKLGAVQDGILRRDRITWTGHIRDSVVFSVTDLDWPSVRAGLDARLAGS